MTTNLALDFCNKAFRLKTLDWKSNLAHWVAIKVLFMLVLNLHQVMVFFILCFCQVEVIGFKRLKQNSQRLRWSLFTSIDDIDIVYNVCHLLEIRRVIVLHFTQSYFQNSSEWIFGESSEKLLMMTFHVRCINCDRKYGVEWFLAVIWWRWS